MAEADNRHVQCAPPDQVTMYRDWLKATNSWSFKNNIWYQPV